MLQIIVPPYLSLTYIVEIDLCVLCVSVVPSTEKFLNSNDCNGNGVTGRISNNLGMIAKN
ncbi:MAG: hypothetical protein EWV48_13140 [Microcystis aeruginosa Ma_QC_C_20070823_S13]|nr:hypothetical protein [Microcystis aeruginosa SX13-11]NCR19605.1 hypothetical protein [Microcystis aeruginosa LL13-03]NCR46343.1 hypothetical protein [Microcystis aeruginosa SX13-01]NCR69038.1 hypothetical protein [Microcystis aeruginosa LL11-07]NCR91807.1 hypothetical protein [Microcystis aeruginosa G13-10]NCS17958.1 hypothetical protein [Microcystis aeruginosa G13-12]NCS22708.1 hypothetical protein [Microcystis aeruginosa G11-06]NCS36849.1 hypothetical protein [Microcystis aeruginosa G11